MHASTFSRGLLSPAVTTILPYGKPAKARPILPMLTFSSHAGLSNVHRRHEQRLQNLQRLQRNHHANTVNLVAAQLLPP